MPKLWFKGYKMTLKIKSNTLISLNLILTVLRKRLKNKSKKSHTFMISMKSFRDIMINF